MAEHLSPLDAMFLEFEQADESAHMHIGAVAVFDPLPGGGYPALEELAQRLETRFESVPRYRQRLSSVRTGGLSWPTWEPDPHFDVRNHLRRAALPAPGDEAELCGWIGDFYSHRLDRTRPLWETVLLEGLEDGRWALASKTHHCLVDGVGSVDVGNLVMDVTSPAAPDARRVQTQVEDHWSTPGLLVRGVRAGVAAAIHPRSMFSQTRAIVEMLIREELIAAPATSLNQPIGGSRRYAAVRVPLEELKAIKRRRGGTINDVVLAVATGALRRVLLSREEPLPPAGLRGQIPVNIRSAEQDMALGNRVATLFVHLPVAESDPLRRYQLVLDEAESRKHGTEGAAAKSLIDLSSLAPPVLHSVLAQALFDVRLFNLTITNVPGSPEVVYAFGAPMREVLPLVPLLARHALGIAAVSYAGEMVFGVNADRALVPDLDVFTDGIRGSLAELQVPTVAERRSRRRAQTLA